LISPHLRPAVGILLLRKLGAPRLLGGSISLVELLHPLLKLGVKGTFLPPQVVDVNEEHDHPLAFARGIVKVGDLEEIKDKKNIIVRYHQATKKDKHNHTLLVL
jgi:hypothetical protein